MYKISRMEFIRQVKGYKLSLLASCKQDITPERLDELLDIYSGTLIDYPALNEGIVKANRCGFKRCWGEDEVSSHLWAKGDTVYKEGSLYFLFTQGRIVYYRLEHERYMQIFVEEMRKEGVL